MKVDLTKGDVATLKVVVGAIKGLVYGREPDEYITRAESLVRRLQSQLEESPVPKRPKRAKAKR